MTKIKLYGVLREKFGKEYNLDVKSPAEAIRALCANLDGFEKFLKEAQDNKIEFKVLADNVEISKIDDLKNPLSKELRIVPVVSGANGEARTLIGAVLITAAFILGGPAASTSASILLNTGAALVISGISQMLAPSPKNTMGPREKAENTPNYSFNGPVNTTAQGHPVPVGYGKMIIGGAVISAGISMTQLQGGSVRKSRIITRDFSYKERTPANYGPTSPTIYRADNDNRPILVWIMDLTTGATIGTEPTPYVSRVHLNSTKEFLPEFGSYDYTSTYRYSLTEWYLEAV